MLTKLTALAKGKVAAAVLGVVLVGGSGGAVAVAASQGHLNGLGLQMGSKQSDSTETPETKLKQDGSHAEGMLTACDTTASTIGVTGEKGTVYAFTVTADTKFNGDIHGNNKGGSSDHGGSSTTSFGLTDLCALVNKVKVQVQATASTSGSTTTYNADKITVEGQGTGDSTGDEQGKPESTETPDAQHTFVGTVSGWSAGGTTFTLTFKNGVQYTVDVSSKTEIDGTLANNAQVVVEGTLSGTTVTAWSVEAADGSGSGDGSGTGSGTGGSGTDN